jgi:hypothetical protein
VPGLYTPDSPLGRHPRADGLSSRSRSCWAISATTRPSTETANDSERATGDVAHKERERKRSKPKRSNKPEYGVTEEIRSSNNAVQNLPAPIYAALTVVLEALEDGDLHYALAVLVDILEGRVA